MTNDRWGQSPVSKAIPESDKMLLRNLAKKQADIAALAIHKHKADLWRKLNRLQAVRPMVWINPYQVPWNEIGIEKQMQTTHCFSREIELQLLIRLYQWAHFPVDMVMDDVLYCPLVIEQSNFGICEESEKIFFNGESSIASHNYKRKIENEDDIDKIKMPTVCFNAERTEYNYNVMKHIFDGIIEVKKRGQPGFWLAPWDTLTTWWGGQELLMDMALRPQLLKYAIRRLMDAYMNMLDQYERLNLLALNNGNYAFGAGTGGPGFSDELPGNDFEPNHVRPHNLWGSAAAQIFSEVSPQMHEEFALEYEIPWLERFGLNYYGCCEPLHKKIDMLKKIPNLRKISMSPWANIEDAAEKIGDGYVFSYKPNPAIFAESDWNPQQVKTALSDTIRTIRRYGCAVEIVLKDVSTVRNKPGKLDQWARLVMELVENIE